MTESRETAQARQQLERMAESIKRAQATVERWESRRRRSEHLDDVADLIASQYDKASTYANVIIAVGYAAFFTVWTSLTREGFERLYLGAGLLEVCSALVFVFWEVFKMTAGALLLRRIIPLLNVAGPHQVQENLARIRSTTASFELALGRIWFLVLVGTLLPGLLGAGGLIALFLLQLFH